MSLFMLSVTVSGTKVPVLLMYHLLSSSRGSQVGSHSCCWSTHHVPIGIVMQETISAWLRGNQIKLEY